VIGHVNGQLVIERQYRMKQSVTIRDVAKVAGVSYQTVSRVINNKGEIRESTRQRVLDAIQQLDYRPSRIAQSMNTRRTYTIGLLVPNIANPFFSDIVTGAQNLAEDNNYNIFLCHTKWQPEKEARLLDSLADHNVDGVIVNSSRSATSVFESFAEQHSPIVLGGRANIKHRNISHVGWNCDYGGRLIAEYLNSKGHKRIGIIAGPETDPTMSNAIRINGILTALTEVGICPPNELIVNGALDSQGGYTEALKLLQHHPDISVIVAHNDLMAIGAMRACRELGLSIPSDCAIVGYNDIELAAMVNPSLTTVRLNRISIGKAMMQRMLDMINKPDLDYPPHFLTDGELVHRESA
jgi:LacI family transcriptional regulator